MNSKRLDLTNQPCEDFFNIFFPVSFIPIPEFATPRVSGNR